MTHEENAIVWSDKILKFLLDKREEMPDLKFWIRRDPESERFKKGLWFQGDGRYIFVGFSRRPGGNLSTRSIGFVVKFNALFEPSCKMEFIFKKEADSNVTAGYNEMLNRIGGFEKAKGDQYKKNYLSADVFENLELFLKESKPIIDEVIKENGIEHQLAITEDDFKQSLDAVLLRREALKNPSKLINLKPLIDAFEKWYITNEHHKNVDFYKETITKEYLSNLNRDEFINFFFMFANEGGKVQSGGNRTAPFLKKTLEENYDTVRAYLLKPFDTDFELDPWISNIDKYKGLGAGMATIYLNRIDKTKYCIVNNKSEDGFKKLGFKVKGKLSTKFHQIAEAAAKLIKAYPKLSNFYKTDALTHFIIAVEEGIEILNELVKGLKTTYHMNEQPLNQILFGPPGTGKTYSTINKALQIVDPKFYKENENNRSELTKRYSELLIQDWENPKGQIAFCTFHQSFSYEDFVEGIKPVEPKEKDAFLKYTIEDGIFKKLCILSEDQAKVKALKTNRLLTWNESDFTKAVFYKISLGDIQDPEDIAIYDYCIENNYISVGFGGGIDFTNLTESEIREVCKSNDLADFDAQALNYFVTYLKVGNYVLVGKGNRYIRAIGKVIGEYEFKSDSPIRYQNFRKVEWLFVNEEIPVEEIYHKNLSQMTIYKLDHKGINKDFFVNNNASIEFDTDDVDKNYVLIIDEINRGNVSSIFGELISSIEKDKRAGENETLSITLPYSKKPFKVPKNIHIIGTMNTADRSVEALDTALRRRFSFKRNCTQKRFNN